MKWRRRRKRGGPVVVSKGGAADAVADRGADWPTVLLYFSMFPFCFFFSSALLFLLFPVTFFLSLSGPLKRPLELLPEDEDEVEGDQCSDRATFSFFPSATVFIPALFFFFFISGFLKWQRQWQLVLVSTISSVYILSFCSFLSLSFFLFFSLFFPFFFFISPQLLSIFSSLSRCFFFLAPSLPPTGSSLSPAFIGQRRHCAGNGQLDFNAFNNKTSPIFILLEMVDEEEGNEQLSMKRLYFKWLFWDVKWPFSVWSLKFWNFVIKSLDKL